MCWSPQVCIILKKRLQHRCFPVNFVKFLRTHFWQNTFERLLLKFVEHLFSFCFFRQICFGEHNSQDFIIIWRSTDFILLLFVSNLLSIAFLETTGVLFSCSFAASFQETTICMTESVFNKVCYVAKYKLHRRRLMSKFSETLMLACRKIFSAFYSILHEAFSSGWVFPLRPWFFKFPLRPSFPLLSYDLKTAWIIRI